MRKNEEEEKWKGKKKRERKNNACVDNGRRLKHLNERRESSSRIEANQMCTEEKTNKTKKTRNVD